MRKIKGLLAVALAASLGAIGTAKADSISFGGYTGPITIKLANKDTGTVYNVADGTYNGASTLNGLSQDRSNLGSVLPGEDAWGIVIVTGIYKGLGDDETPANALYLQGDPAHQGTKEITGIFFGQTDTFLKVTTTGPGQETEEIHSTGVQAAFFVDNTPDYSSLAGPGARTNVGGAPSYNTVTDGTLLWTFNSTTGFSGAGGFTPDPSAEFFTTVGVTNGTVTGVNGSGGFNAVVGTNALGTGNQNNLLASDVTVTFTGSRANQSVIGGPNWAISSQDPINAVAVPLPSEVGMGMLCIGGMLVGAYRRSRKLAD